MNAADEWRDALDALAIPGEILDRAPESPYGFPVQRFADAADAALREPEPSPSMRRALEALPVGGSVLDVGCGGGAASLPLASTAGLLVGVDENEAMLRAFADRVQRLGVAYATIAGRWPDIAPVAPEVDVAVCHHVTYNVPDLPGLAAALTEHARHRVVVEMTTEHPLAWMAPLWQELHGLDRSAGPTVDDALKVLAEAGHEVGQERWSRPYRLAGSSEDEMVAFVRRRLCVGSERDEEIRRALHRTHLPEQHGVVTLWWNGKGPSREADGP